MNSNPEGSNYCEPINEGMFGLSTNRRGSEMEIAQRCAAELRSDYLL